MRCSNLDNGLVGPEFSGCPGYDIFRHSRAAAENLEMLFAARIRRFIPCATPPPGDSSCVPGLEFAQNFLCCAGWLNAIYPGLVTSHILHGRTFAASPGPYRALYCQRVTSASEVHETFNTSGKILLVLTNYTELRPLHSMGWSSRPPTSSNSNFLSKALPFSAASQLKASSKESSEAVH